MYINLLDLDPLAAIDPKNSEVFRDFPHYMFPKMTFFHNFKWFF